MTPAQATAILWEFLAALSLLLSSVGDDTRVTYFVMAGVFALLAISASIRSRA